MNFAANILLFKDSQGVIIPTCKKAKGKGGISVLLTIALLMSDLAGHRETI